MKNLVALMTLLFFASPSISYFKYQRPVQLVAAGQNFVVVDEAMWNHARADLGDLRLYSGQTELPYAFVIERASLANDQRAVKVLQQAVVGGKTQFFLDMEGVPEYDHVDLQLATKDFVAHANVEGQDDLHATKWALLGSNIVYDFSSERLGANRTLRLPLSRYKYLRITIDGPVKPKDVQSATAVERQEDKAVWRDISSEAKREQKDRDTIFTFTVPENIPVERVMFVVDPVQPNFRRAVEVKGDKDITLSSGEINRVHMVRRGQKIDCEGYDVDFFSSGQKTVQVIVHNGDDPPLKISSAHLQQLERRLYFDAPSTGALALYYGDEKLERPVYDYAKLFQKEKSPLLAQTGPEESNKAFTGRPDDRPWSERHPAVLWIAIVLAVLVLGGLAVRSMKTAAA